MAYKDFVSLPKIKFPFDNPNTLNKIQSLVSVLWKTDDLSAILRAIIISSSSLSEN